MTYPFVSLGEVVASSTGTANPGKAPLDTFRYVDVAAVDNVQKRIVGTRDVLGSEAPSRARKLISANDVLVSTVRPNLNAVAIVPGILQGAIASTGFSVLRATQAALPEFIFYFVQSQRFIESLCKLTAGALYPAVTDRQVLEQRLPLPPLAEQRRIVDILSRAESIVRLRREAQKKAAELIPALFTDLFGDPATNPKDWPVKPLRELVKFVGGATPPKSREDFWQGDLPWVSPKDMKRLEISDAEDHLDVKVLMETNLKLIPANSILVVVRGMILAHSLPLAITRSPVTINQDMKAFTPLRHVEPDYLFWALMASKGTLQNKIDAAAHGTKKLDTEHLVNLNIPIPPRSLQVAWADKARAVTSIQTQQATATTQAEATFNALLAQVFAPV